MSKSIYKEHQERVLVFKYYNKNDAKQLIELLKSNQIKFLYYPDWDAGYNYSIFKVCRSNRKWKEIMELINSINAPVYKYENIYVIDGKEHIIIEL